MRFKTSAFFFFFFVEEGKWIFFQKHGLGTLGEVKILRLLLHSVLSDFCMSLLFSPTSTAVVSPISPDVFPKGVRDFKHLTVGTQGGVTLLTCSLLGFSFIGTSLNQLLWAHHHVYSVNSKNMLVFFSPHYNILPVLQRHVGALQVWALLSFYINRTWVMRKIILALTFRLTFC